MKKLLIIILFVPLLMKGQNPVIYGGTNPLYAIDLDGSTECAYVNSPSGLDLNSANYLSGDNTAFTSTAGNWVGLTQTSGKATFSTSATLATSYLSTQFIEGHNYTVQLKAKSNGILGSELINNGNFSNTTKWQLGTGWTIGSGVAHYDKFTNAWIKQVQDSMAGALPIGTYRISFDISNIVGDTKVSIYVLNAAGNVSYIARTDYTSGHKDIDFMLGATGSGISFYAYTTGGSFDIDNISLKSVAYSPLKIKVGTDSTSISTTATETTYAFTFTYHSGSQIEQKGNGTDTYTIDDIDVSEAYDLEIEGYFKANNIATTQYMLSTNTGDNIRLGLTSSKLYFRPDNSQSSSYVYSSTLSSNTWYKYKVLYNRLTKVASCYINNTIDNGTQSTSSAWLYRENTTGLRIGLMSTTYFSGLIGWTDIKLKNGLGTIVSQSKYDWKGSASTFLNDKKGTNNLTGVDVTLPDVVKYSQGKYK